MRLRLHVTLPDRPPLVDRHPFLFGLTLGAILAGLIGLALGAEHVLTLTVLFVTLACAFGAGVYTEWRKH